MFYRKMYAMYRAPSRKDLNKIKPAFVTRLPIKMFSINLKNTTKRHPILFPLPYAW